MTHEDIHAYQQSRQKYTPMFYPVSHLRCLSLACQWAGYDAFNETWLSGGHPRKDKAFRARAACACYLQSVGFSVDYITEVFGFHKETIEKYLSRATRDKCRDALKFIQEGM